MSTYFKLSKNPNTGEWEAATWIDDFYGRHHYGVQFPNGDMFDPERDVIETRDTSVDPWSTAPTNVPIPQPENVKKTCTSIHCPERKSICCGAMSRAASGIELMMGVPEFFCSKCGKTFVGPECTAIADPLCLRCHPDIKEDLGEDLRVEQCDEHRWKEEERLKIKKDLLKIADEGELEELRHYVEHYFSRS